MSEERDRPMEEEIYYKEEKGEKKGEGEEREQQLLVR